jgi:hypothetical protein
MVVLNAKWYSSHDVLLLSVTPMICICPSLPPRIELNWIESSTYPHGNSTHYSISVFSHLVFHSVLQTCTGTVRHLTTVLYPRRARDFQFVCHSLLVSLWYVCMYWEWIVSVVIDILVLYLCSVRSVDLPSCCSALHYQYWLSYC